MEYYNNILCISQTELTDGIASAATIKWWNQQGKVERVRRGCKNSSALYAVSSLPFKYRQEVYRRNPDCQAAAAGKTFENMIEPDAAAIEFYKNYRLKDGRYLSVDKQAEYSNNAAILNAFRTMLQKSDSMRTKANRARINRGEFWQKAAKVLPRLSDNYPNSLPANARRLQDKFTLYVKDGYEALVTGKFGNPNAAKINTDEQKSLLVQLMSTPLNWDNEQIAAAYNIMAAEKGWKTITAAAVATWKEKEGLVTAAGRLGVTRFRNQKEMLVKRKRPTMPLLYWTIDGWTVELMYQKTDYVNGQQRTTYTNRLSIVVLLDTCCNYPIGYAIGDRETPELIKEAVRNGINHTADLFGKRYKVNQLQSDNYGRGNLTPVYKAACKIYTPARAHNSKAKVIEPYFKTLNKNYCQMELNWSGFGVTSDRNLQPNAEYLNKCRKSFPDKSGCEQQIVAMMEKERARLHDQYMQMFSQMPDDMKIPMSIEEYLYSFGCTTGRKNAIEGTGLRPTIDGIKRDYDCFDIHFRELSHIKWTVLYDPADVHNVLAINDDHSQRFLLEEKYVQPMALAERKPGDAEQLAKVHRFNKSLEEHIDGQLLAHRKRVEELFNNSDRQDLATRLLICDSRGQNKIYKSTKHLHDGCVEIEDTQTEQVRNAVPKLPDDDEDIYSIM